MRLGGNIGRSLTGAHHRTAGLAADAGQTVRIQFTAQIDSSLPTAFAIDDATAK